MEIDLDDSLGFRINKVANQINIAYNSLLRPFGIAWEQRTTLRIIKKEKSVTLTKISLILSKDKTTVSRTLRALEDKGFIEKNSNLNDRRTSIIKPTPKGEEILEKTKKFKMRVRKSLASKMSEEEVKELLRLLGKVNVDLGCLK